MKTFQLFKSAFRNLHLYLRVCIIIKHEQVILITSKYFSKSFKLQKNRHLRSQLKPNYRPLNQQQPVIFAFLLRLAIGIISTSLKQSSVAIFRLFFPILSQSTVVCYVTKVVIITSSCPAKLVNYVNFQDFQNFLGGLLTDVSILYPVFCLITLS